MTEHSDSDYVSGDDYVVEFLDYRYGFSEVDFSQRVSAAAVRLELVAPGELSEAEAADLVELAAGGDIDSPRSALGEHLTAHLNEIDRLHSQPVSYWLRKLVFRGAWLDHRVKAGMLDVQFDERGGSFDYRMPTDDTPLIELATAPSWAELRFRP
jgi:hypothetical protein